MTNFEKCCEAIVKDLSLHNTSQVSPSYTVTMGLYQYFNKKFIKVNGLQGRACSMFLRKPMRNGEIGKFHAGVILIKEGYEQKHNKRYYDWLFNESPFKDCYYTKYVDKTAGNAVFINFKQPYQLTYAATIMLRVWEYAGKARAFDVLVKGGVSPAMASLMKWFCTAKMDGSVIIADPHSSNHTFPCADGVFRNKSATKLWLNNTVVVDTADYRSQGAMFPFSNTGIGARDVIKKIITMGTSKKSEPSGKFAWFNKQRDNSIGGSFSVEELCERINKLEQELLK